MSPRPSGPLRILGAAVLFSTGGAAIKACSLTGWQIAGTRSAVAAVAVLLMLPGARRALTPRSVAVGAAYAATLILYVLANKLTTAANAIFLQSTAPLWLLLLGPWLLREPARRRDLLTMVALGAGLSLFFAGVERPVGTAPDPASGNLLGAVSGLTWALTIAGLRWIGRAGAGGRGREEEAAGAVVAGNVLAAAVALPMGAGGPVPAPGDVALIIYLGAVQIGLAYVLLTRGVRHVPALEVSLLLLLEPVLNPLWTGLVHGERPSLPSLAGGAIILAATAVKAWIDARSPVGASPRDPRASR